MNKAETAKIIATIQEVYPNFMNGRTPEKTVDLWQMLFATDDYKTVSAAVVAFLASDNKGFAPVPGQIKEKIAQMNDSDPEETQAWAMVCRAMERASRAAFAKLPALIQQCIGSPETLMKWGDMDMGTVDTVIAASFMRTYRAKMQKQREYGKLPAFAKASYPALAEQQAYRLPRPREVSEPVDDRVGPPDSVMQTVAGIRAVLDSSPRAIQELKDQAQRNAAIPGVMDGLLKGGKA